MELGIKTIATKITVGRLLVCPLFVVLFYLAVPGPGYDGLVEGLDPGLMGAALGVMLLLEASDLADGFMARRRRAVTEFGKLLDPLADTLNHMGVFLCLMWVGLVPLWLLVILYYREAVVSTLRVIAAKEGLVIGARVSGKLKSIGLGGGAALLLGFLLIAHYHPSFPLRIIADVFSWIIGAMALVSGIDYTVSILRQVKRIPG